MNKYDGESENKKRKQYLLPAFIQNPPIKKRRQQCRIGKAKWKTQRIQKKIKNGKREIPVYGHTYH
jgi:hypothetical protein